MAEHRLDHTPFLVPPGAGIRLADYDPAYTAGLKNKEEGREALLEDVSGLADAQNVLWASKEYAIIILFQALDAAGKDGTIKHVMSGVNPQGVRVYSFKAPSEEERQHHYLWRPTRVLPARGMIHIFNRSYYEEVLVVRVHPEFLDTQWLQPDLRGKKLSHVWEMRYQEINAFEEALTSKYIRVLKFFLHVSKQEQKERFLKRLDDPDKNWKFSADDVRERRYWDDYQAAYEEMLNATSTKSAPWYVIPADKKWFMRACVADIITSHIEALDLRYPTVAAEDRTKLAEARRELEAE